VRLLTEKVKWNFTKRACEALEACFRSGSWRWNRTGQGQPKSSWFRASRWTLIAKGASLDCLWLDVQGAELLVLKGAERLLPNVRSIFVEVSVRPELYRGSATFAEIDSLLRGFGFQLALLGLDKAVLTGNAFYIRTH